MEQKPRIPLTEPGAYLPLNSYGDLAQRWEVSDKTVFRWFKRLAKKAKLVVFRPSAQTVRFSAEEAARFWSLAQAFWDAGKVIRRERIPEMIPVKVTTTSQRRR